jgi:adenylate cyclase
MTTESSTILRLDLKQQVLIVNQLIEQLRDELQKSGSTIPPRLSQAVTQLLTSLGRLNKQINQLDDDHNNLIALADVSQVVNSSLELDEVLRIVMDTIIRLTGAERGFLMLRDDGTEGKLVIHVARNWEKVSLDSSEHLISQTVINRVVSEGLPVLTTNAQEDDRFGKQESIIAYNLRSILCVPLKFKGAVTGVIYADNRIKTGIFSEAKRNLLTTFANQAAVAIENARLFESVRRTLNEVTELKNLMDNVFASIASGVITADIEDKVLLCNRATEAILGRSHEDMVNQYLRDVFLVFAPELATYIETVRETDQYLVGLEFNPVLPGRGQVMLSLNLSPLKDADQATQGVAIVVDDLTEKKRLEKQRTLFERMVPPAVIGQLDPDQLQLGGKRSQITTLFADVRGFTSFSEKHDPELLVSILNRYLSVSVNAILKEYGTLDKFMGDGIMALFNAPIPQPDHSLRAVRAALAMRDSLKELHQELPAEFHLSYGVGIHYGIAVLGLIGAQSRADFTAIGDSVNTAKRIQENAAGGQILISESAYAQVADQIVAREVDPIMAKGKSLPVVVYEVMGLK